MVIILNWMINILLLLASSGLYHSRRIRSRFCFSLYQPVASKSFLCEPFLTTILFASFVPAEDREDYYERSEDRTTPSSTDYDERYGNYEDEDCDEQAYIAENERLEEEYIRYFKRQCSLPEDCEREHGASF